MAFLATSKGQPTPVKAQQVQFFLSKYSCKRSVDKAHQSKDGKTVQFLVRCASFSRSHFVTQRASFSLGYLVRSGLPTFCNVTNTIYNFNKSIFCNRTTTFFKQNQPPKNCRKNLKVQHLQSHQKETNESHQNAVASAVSDLNPNFFLKLCERKLKIAANVHLDPE